jgi:hypothetical protein
MKPNRSATLLALGVAVLAAAGCRQAPPAPAPPAPAAPAPASATAQTTPQEAAPPLQPAPVQVCSLLSAAEVSAAMGKTLVRGQDGGCDFGLDPSAKQKELAKNQDMSALMRSMQHPGAHHRQPGSSLMEQMNVSLSASRDDQTEEAVKAVYAQTGAVVRGALAPEKHGLNGVIQGLDEIAGVGDWAFATNVASVNMGMGFSIRGRLLEARKGPWHVTLSATVAPDPGAEALDGHLTNLARALLAKL